MFQMYFSITAIEGEHLASQEVRAQQIMIVWQFFELDGCIVDFSS